MPKDPVKREETLKRMREAQRYRDPPSDVTRKKMSESAKNRAPSSYETRKKISDGVSGENHPMFGKNHKEESKKKMSEKKTGENHPNFGKHLSQETRDKISKMIKITYSSQPEEILVERHQKISKSHCDKYGNKAFNWRGGISFLPYCPKFNKILKKNVRNFFGNTCVICGKTPGRNKAELAVHHVFTEKMACCETKIEELDGARKRFPKDVARFGENKFSEEEIKYIRMMVPLCVSCHSKQNNKSEEVPYEETKYRKFFTELILNKYGGKCFSTDGE
jgi:hypothetical protein